MNANVENKLKTGTTTLGMIYKDGVVLATDTQSTASYIESRSEKKLHAITENIAVTTAGVVGDIQAVVRFLKAEARIYQMNNGKISTRGIVTLLSNVLHSSRMFPFITAMLVGGYNGKPEIFAVDPYGGVGSGENFFVTGSGAPLAMGVLESSYGKDMTEKQAVGLAKKAIATAQERDAYTGGRNISVAVVDPKGFREIK